MSAEEIHGLAMGQAQALQQQNAVLQRFNQPVQQAPRNAFDFDLPDDEYMTGKQVKGILQQFANQPAPIDQNARNLAAQSVWGLIQVQRPDDFKRWGDEINREASKLPVEHWTLDNLKIVVDIVKSRHIDELAAEKAQRLVDESHPTIRSGGSGGSGSGPYTQQRTLASDTLPQGWVDRARAAGINEATVREFCELTGQTPDQYLADVEKFGKNAVLRG